MQNTYQFSKEQFRTHSAVDFIGGLLYILMAIYILEMLRLPQICVDCVKCTVIICFILFFWTRWEYESREKDNYIIMFDDHIVIFTEAGITQTSVYFKEIVRVHWDGFEKSMGITWITIKLEKRKIKLLYYENGKEIYDIISSKT